MEVRGGVHECLNLKSMYKLGTGNFLESNRHISMYVGSA